ncbi:MAG: acyltransferase [Sandarakinorhabdus sp.]|nr:acyltransferase [Sandarakinorhabdus sp.]
MRLYNNRSSGFDYLRLGLSLAVFIWHCFVLSSLTKLRNTPFLEEVHMILPMFFALSGFLVSGSMLRTKTIREFITLRAVRIMPALAAEVLLSAFLIGTIMTILPLKSYFQDDLFRVYFWNLVGHVQFLLPGVFTSNPLPLVNISLWTIPYELYCYLAIVILWMVGAVPHRKWLLLALVITAQLALPIRDAETDNLIRTWASNVPGRFLVLSFLYGVVIYAFAEVIVMRWWMAVVAAAMCAIMMHWAIAIYFMAFPAAYLTVFLGLTNPPRIPVLMDGDYSYGIYLYAGPIQQMVIDLFPAHRNGLFVMAVAILPICLFAAFSWHVIEKPVLGRRKSVIAAVMRTTDQLVSAFRRLTGRRHAPAAPPTQD